MGRRSRRRRSREKKSKPKTSKPFYIGLLLVAIGVINIVNGIYVGVAVSNGWQTFPGWPEQMVEIIHQTIAGCVAIEVALSLVTIIGGVYCIRREKWIIAFIGSICGIVTAGPYCLTNVISIIAVILVFLIHDEFKDV